MTPQADAEANKILGVAPLSASAASPDRAGGPAPPIRAPRIRLEFLDGLRGLSALYVMLNHASILCAGIVYPALSRFPSWLAKPYLLLYHGFLDYGVYGVCVFIVLSGYCLMLPAVRSAAQDVDGFMPFMRRRARRILPPYYAMLAVSLLLLAALPLFGLSMETLSAYRFLKDSFSAGSIASHLLLVHALTPWRVSIDPPMWSVSVEWGIYFFLPLLLLPLYRRNTALMLGAALVIGLLPTYAAHYAFEDAHLWFLFLFALGAAAAALSFGPEQRFGVLRRFHHWGWLSIILALALAGITLMQRNYFEQFFWLRWLRWEHWSTRWPQDVLVGATAAAFIVYCAESVRKFPGRSRLVAALSSPSLKLLGDFSYSLYLVHAPLLEVVAALARKHTTPLHAFVLMLLGGIPLALAASYAFHLVFERPFQRRARAPVTEVFASAPQVPET